MGTKKTAWACGLAAAMAAGSAGATHPDYEGERGPEVELAPVVAGSFTGDESVFLRDADLPRPESGPPLDSFGVGGGFNLAAGWRFAPFVSAGVSAGVQFYTPANVYTRDQANLDPVDSIRSFQVGVYGRLYPMAFFNGSRANPRVFFESWGDRRRIEPWVSLGLQFASFRRYREYNDVSFPDSYATWTTNYLAVPIAVGAEYRLITRLAVGVTLGLTPHVAGATSKYVFRHEVRPGFDMVYPPEESSYTPAASSLTTWYLGLGVRYTFTY